MRSTGGSRLGRSRACACRVVVSVSMRWPCGIASLPHNRRRRHEREKARGESVAGGRRLSGWAAAKALAQQLEAQLRETAAAEFAGHPTGSVGEFIDSVWLPRQIDLRSATVDGYESHVKNYIRPLLGDLPIAQLDGDTASQFVID